MLLTLYTKQVGCESSYNGILAQLGEHLPYKQRVIGSSPIGPIQYGEIAQLARAHGSYRSEEHTSELQSRE